VELDSNQTILLSDTVGFIRKIPHHLIASFRSTLKEVVEADLVLFVLDASSPQIAEHYSTITDVLKDIGAGSQEQIIVLNKIDVMEDDGRITFLKREYPDAVFISAREHLRIDALLDVIKSKINEDYKTVEMVFGYDQGKEMAAAQDGVTVLDRIYDEDRVRLLLKGPQHKLDKISASLKK